MSKHGHIAVRTCLVCRRKKPKGELLRLGLDPESGIVSIDVAGKMKGRGGYSCPQCLSELRLDKRVQRAFRNRVKQLCAVQDLT